MTTSDSGCLGRGIRNSQRLRELAVYGRRVTDSTTQTPLESTVRTEIAQAEDPERRVRRTMRRMRAWVSKHPRFELVYRVGIAVFGGALALGGLLLVPLPGPGWLIVFLGLAILGTEFHWARRTARWLKRQLDRFWAWWKARSARKADTRTAQRGSAVEDGA